MGLVPEELQHLPEALPRLQKFEGCSLVEWKLFEPAFIKLFKEKGCHFLINLRREAVIEDLIVEEAEETRFRGISVEIDREELTELLYAKYAELDAEFTWELVCNNSYPDRPRELKICSETVSLRIVN